MKPMILVILIAVIFASNAFCNSNDWLLLNYYNYDIPNYPININGSDITGRIYFKADETYVFDQKKVRMLSFNNIISVACSADSSKWFLVAFKSENGRKLFRLNSRDSSIKNITEVDPNAVFAIANDRAFNVWFLTDTTLVRLSGGSKTTFSTAGTKFSRISPCSMTVDNDNRIWIATRGRGIFRFDGSKWTVYNKINQGLGADSIYSINSDLSGNVWAVSGNPLSSAAGSLFRFRSGKWEKMSWENSGLPTTHIVSMAPDLNGDMWFAACDGASPFRFNGARFDSVEKPSGISQISSVAIDNKGNKWFGAGNSLVAYRKGGPMETALPKFPLPPKPKVICGNDYIKLYWERDQYFKNLTYRLYIGGYYPDKIKASGIKDTFYLYKVPFDNYYGRYEIRAFDSATGRESRTNPDYIVEGSTIYNLNSPDGLVQICSEKGILLQWRASYSLSLNPGIFHRVYRSDSSGKNYVLIKDSLRENFYEDLSFKPSVDQFYIVTAAYPEGNLESGPTNEVRTRKAVDSKFEDWRLLRSDKSLLNNDIFFVDDNNGWLAANTGYVYDYSNYFKTMGNGKLFRTTDGGSSWQEFNLGMKKVINFIYFSDKYNGWLSVSDSNKPTNGDPALYHSSDGGKSWANANVDTSFHIKSITFLNSSDGWASGYIANRSIMLRTNDGGRSWIDLSDSGNALQFSKIMFIDSLNGFGLCNYGQTGELKLTSDGGHTWHNTSRINVFDFSCVNGRIWIASDQNRVGSTSDMGQTWEITPMKEYCRLFAISFSDSLHGIAAGSNSMIFYTNDGGASWNRNICTKATDNFRKLCFHGSRNFWIMGDSTVMRTTSAGAISERPDEAANLRNVPDEKKIILKWDKCPMSAFFPGILYNVYKSQSPDGDWELSASKLPNTEFTDSTGLKRETVYYYTIRSYMPETGLESDTSNIIGAFLNAPPLPPTGITCSVNKKRVTLKWLADTSVSVNYLIYRKKSSDAEYTLLEKEYPYLSYTDKDIDNDGEYYYALQSQTTVLKLLSDTSEVVRAIVSGIEDNATDEGLSARVYPNPAARTFVIDIHNQHPGRLGISLINTLGSEVARLKDEYIQEGAYSLDFDRTSGGLAALPAGIYYIRIETPGRIIYRKICFL